MRGKHKDLTGQRFGRLLAVKKIGFVKQSSNPTSSNISLYECQCDCTNVLEVKGSSLASGNTTSCGCKRTDRALELTKTRTRRKLLLGAKRRAKKQGLNFNLTLEDITVPDTCPLLGIPLEENIGTGPRYDTLPSLDKKDPSKGYIKGNVWVVSWRANRIKNDASVEELERMVAGLKRVA